MGCGASNDSSQGQDWEVVQANMTDRRNRVLDYTGLGLQIMPPSIKGGSEVKVLILRNNTISQLIVDFSNWTSLEEIDLRNNRFIRVPAALTSAKNLTSLDMSNNPISRLNGFEALPKISKLSTLSFRNTNIKYLHEELKQCTSLTELNLSGNTGLELDWHGILQDIPHLTSLDIAYCNLGKESNSKAPKALQQCVQLTKLNISGNAFNLRPADAFGECGQSLTTLICGDCGFKSLPQASICSKLINLTELNLSDSKTLQSLQRVGGLTKLKVLKLSNCQLENLLPGCEELPWLEELDLSENPKLSLLDGLADCFPNLRFLSVINCPFAEHAGQDDGVWCEIGKIRSIEGVNWSSEVFFGDIYNTKLPLHLFGTKLRLYNGGKIRAELFQTLDLVENMKKVLDDGFYKIDFNYENSAVSTHLDILETLVNFSSTAEDKKSGGTEAAIAEPSTSTYALSHFCQKALQRDLAEEALKASAAAPSIPATEENKELGHFTAFGADESEDDDDDGEVRALEVEELPAMNSNEEGKTSGESPTQVPPIITTSNDGHIKEESGEKDKSEAEQKKGDGEPRGKNSEPVKKKRPTSRSPQITPPLASEEGLSGNPSLVFLRSSNEGCLSISQVFSDGLDPFSYQQLLFRYLMFLALEWEINQESTPLLIQQSLLLGHSNLWSNGSSASPTIPSGGKGPIGTPVSALQQTRHPKDVFPFIPPKDVATIHYAHMIADPSGYRKDTARLFGGPHLVPHNSYRLWFPVDADEVKRAATSSSTATTAARVSPPSSVTPPQLGTPPLESGSPVELPVEGGIGQSINVENKKETKPPGKTSISPPPAFASPLTPVMPLPGARRSKATLLMDSVRIWSEKIQLLRENMETLREDELFWLEYDCYGNGSYYKNILESSSKKLTQKIYSLEEVKNMFSIMFPKWKPMVGRSSSKVLLDAAYFSASDFPVSLVEFFSISRDFLDSRGRYESMASQSFVRYSKFLVLAALYGGNGKYPVPTLGIQLILSLHRSTPLKYVRDMAFIGLSSENGGALGAHGNGILNSNSVTPMDTPRLGADGTEVTTTSASTDQGEVSFSSPPPPGFGSGAPRGCLQWTMNDENAAKTAELWRDVFHEHITMREQRRASRSNTPEPESAAGSGGLVRGQNEFGSFRFGKRDNLGSNPVHRKAQPRRSSLKSQEKSLVQGQSVSVELKMVGGERDGMEPKRTRKVTIATDDVLLA